MTTRGVCNGEQMKGLFLLFILAAISSCNSDPFVDAPATLTEEPIFVTQGGGSLGGGGASGMEISPSGDARIWFSRQPGEEDAGVFRGGRRLYEAVRNELAPLRTVAPDVNECMASAASDERFAGFVCGAEISDASPIYVAWSEGELEQRTLMAQRLCPSKQVQAVATRIERARNLVWCAAEQRGLLNDDEPGYCDHN